MIVNTKLATAALTLLTIVTTTNAHSWVEELQVISDNGSYVGDYGYTRGYVARTDPGFNGDSVDYLLPPLSSGRTRINGNDLLCHPDQRTSNYSSTYPRLQITPGGYLAMKYLENGHVTLPQNQLGKPKSGGTVFVYATCDPSDTEKIVDVLDWNSSGSGGDKRGMLIASNNFDDGRCHQLNPGTISQQRQKDFPDRVPGQPTSQVEQWCETDVQIPASIAKAGHAVTLYWVWQWPTAPGGSDPTYPTGKDEYYTSCAEVQVVDNISDAVIHTLVQQDPQTAAVSDWKSRTAYTASPSVTVAGASGASYGASASASGPASSSVASYSASSSSYTAPVMTSSSASSSSSVAASAYSSFAGSSSGVGRLANSLPYITYSLSYLPTASVPSSSSAAVLSSSPVTVAPIASVSGFYNSTQIVTEIVTSYITVASSASSSVQADQVLTKTELATTIVTVTASPASSSSYSSSYGFGNSTTTSSSDVAPQASIVGLKWRG